MNNDERTIMETKIPELCSDECAHVWFARLGLPVGRWIDTESDDWQENSARFDGEEYCDWCGHSRGDS